MNEEHSSKHTVVIFVFFFVPSINEPDKDPGFGQSILHEAVLIFRTPPYIVSEISLQDNQSKLQPSRKTNESPKLVATEQEDNIENEGQLASNRSTMERKKKRRCSASSIK